MKKKRIIILLLCVCLLLQTLPAHVSAEEGDQEETLTGNVTVDNGCKTIEAMSPLGGNQRRLETAQAAFVYEVSTDTVIYSYNPDLKLYPGSLSKMLTALIAIEQVPLTEKITVSTREISKLPVGSITAKFKEGEIVTMEDVLHALILTSANDAALIIAGHIGGNEATFVEMMNQRARKIGCTNTQFTNCHGLDDINQHTTARDMARITTEAMKNETFAKIFGTMSYDVPPTNRSEKKRELASGNHLMYDLVITKYNDRRVTGGMPSYSSAIAGASIAFTAKDKGMDLVFVIMGANRTFNDNGNADYYGNFDEAQELLIYTFGGYKVNQLLYPGMSLHQFKVNDGECNVVGTPKVSMNAVLPADAHMNNLIMKYSVMDGGIKAPIEEGDKIASVQLWYGASCMAEVDLFAMNDVRDQDETGVEIYGPSRNDSNIWGLLAIVLLILVGVFGAYLAYNSYRRAMARARRKKKRASRRRSR